MRVNRPTKIVWLVTSVMLVTVIATILLNHCKCEQHYTGSSVNHVAPTAPRPNETCFSPDEQCDAKLVSFIQEAHKSLDVAIYDINLDQLVYNLVIKAKKITVRIVVDQRQSRGRHSLVDLLAKAGVNIRYGRQRGIMHNKFVIRDSTMIETGSFNYTNHAAAANSENQVYLNDAALVDRYQVRFEKIWAEAEPVTLSTDVSANEADSAIFDK